MTKKGRPILGREARSERVLICIEPSLRADLAALAVESRRSMSDYCRYVLEEHAKLVREEDGIPEPEPMPEPPPVPTPVVAKEDAEYNFKCSICFKSFQDCDCAENGYR